MQARFLMISYIAISCQVINRESSVLPLNLYSLSVWGSTGSSLKQHLVQRLERLQNRRLTIFYKLLCQESIPIEVPSCYLYHTNYQTRNYHPLHLMIPSSYALFYQKSYFPDWYNLPLKVIESKSPQKFYYYPTTLMAGPL